MEQRGAEDRQQSRRHGYDDRYDEQHDERYDDPRGAQYADPRYDDPAPRKSGKPKALIATSVALAVFAAGAVAVVASGVLKQKDDKTAAATSPAPVTATSPQTSGPSPSSPAQVPSPYSNQVPTVSDGTNIVRVNHREVKFPSTVTGAIWSPNGTRLAYIDGDGNVATALPDGTDVRVLTKKKTGIQRAHVAWTGDGTEMHWDSRTGTGRWLLATAGVNDAPKVESDLRTWAADPADKGDNTEYAATSTSTDAVGSVPDTPDVFRIDDTIYEDAYLRAHLDPDSNGYGGWGWASVAQGSDPAVAPDGRVVYVGTNGQLWIAGTSEAFKVNPVQISFTADHPSHPAWSPDGKRIAFETTSDVESVSTDVQTGATANPTQQEDPKPGVPSYQRTEASPAVLAFDGVDSAAAAVNLSQAKWTDYRTAFKTPVPKARGAILVPAGLSPTAMTAAIAFAGYENLPLYPMAGGTLDPRVGAELTRLFGQHDKRKFVTLYLGSTVPDAVGSAVSAATGSAPIPVTYQDAYDLGYRAEAAFKTADNKNNGFAGDPVTPQPAAITLVAAVDDQPAVLAALGAAVQTVSAPGTFRIILTKGSTMPASAQPILNAAKGASVVTIGAHAAAALATGWSGKPALEVTELSGATPVVLADAVAKGVPAALEAMKRGTITPTTATVLPQPTAATWTGELLTAAESGGTVLFTDSSATLDSASTAFLRQNLASLIHVDTFGDGTALAAGLSKALGTPIPFQVLTDPKAPMLSGN